MGFRFLVFSFPRSAAKCQQSEVTRGRLRRLSVSNRGSSVSGAVGSCRWSIMAGQRAFADDQSLKVAGGWFFDQAKSADGTPYQFLFTVSSRFKIRLARSVQAAVSVAGATARGEDSPTRIAR